PATDILSLQEEISREISQNLRVRFGDQEAEQVLRVATRNSEAYQLYLKGRYYWNKRTEDGTRKSIQYFNQAVETDPGFAVAYAGLADAYIILGGYNTVPPSDAFPAARAAAERALEIDPSLAEAHASLGDIEIHFGWDWERADAEFRQAIQKDSSYATAYQWYGEYLGAVGRHDEAIAIAKRGRELDPLAPIISTYVGLNYLLARDFVTAKAEFERTIELTPDFPWARLYYGQCLGAMGLKDDMVKQIEAAKDLYDHPMIQAYLSYAYAVTGREGEAREILGALTQSARVRYISPFYFAIVHLGLGNRNEALKWLEQGAADRSPTMFLIGVHPHWDPLRNEPRFTAVLERVGLSHALPHEKWATQ
ncbi:MAG: tetratricopeptide repeat protein, partial [Ignavibacteria bacterium]|nr:tetratricopeptide repeat protein [Ignavibacteria bacterium]